MIELTRKMYKCARLLKKGLTDTSILAKEWGCNFWAAQFRLKHLKGLGVIETKIARSPYTGKFSGIEILKIYPFIRKEQRHLND